MNEITRNKALRAEFTPPMGGAPSPNRPKFEVYAEEIIEKEVKQSGERAQIIYGNFTMKKDSKNPRKGR